MSINWENWAVVVIPVAVFVVIFLAMLWLRRLAFRTLDRWLRTTRWQGDEILLKSMNTPSLFWCFVISAAVAIAISSLSGAWKSLADKGLGTLFVIGITLVAIGLAGGLILLYGPALKLSKQTNIIIKNITNGIILVVTALVLLDIWGAPTTPIILLIILAALAAALAFRDAAPNLFAGFQLSATQQMKVGDYIKLETGEEGFITGIRWNNTLIKTVDESVIIIPNSRLLRHTVINYGHPLKKAKEPFHFNSRTQLPELTSLKAKNLRELSEILKTVPDSIIYYHTHSFLEEHHYLTPEPSNDFALWVNDVLGDQVLGERLASVDTFSFPNLGALRGRLVTIMDEALASDSTPREAAEGREFHFIKSVSVIFPTPYVAHDLREFVEALRKISLGALYFHMFESRLRLGKSLNDFTTWLKDSLDEAELGDQIARLDPYTYTLEGLRSSLIQLIEKRIK